jgi:predicted HicB family RNase H-like nuclease
MINYKGYLGQFIVDNEAALIRGKVINTRDVITFHGANVKEAEQAFRDSVDDYIDFCRSIGEAPEKPYSGKVSLRLQPELHARLHVLARMHNKSVNKYIVTCLSRLAKKVPRLTSGDPEGWSDRLSAKASRAKSRTSIQSGKRKKSTV